MNRHGAVAIFGREMARFFRTIWQSIASPVVSTALYFVVFGSAIGGRIQSVDKWVFQFGEETAKLENTPVRAVTGAMLVALMATGGTAAALYQDFTVTVDGQTHEVSTMSRSVKSILGSAGIDADAVKLTADRLGTTGGAVIRARLGRDDLADLLPTVDDDEVNAIDDELAAGERPQSGSIRENELELIRQALERHPERVIEIMANPPARPAQDGDPPA